MCLGRINLNNKTNKKKGKEFHGTGPLKQLLNIINSQTWTSWVTSAMDWQFPWLFINLYIGVTFLNVDMRLKISYKDIATLQLKQTWRRRYNSTYIAMPHVGWEMSESHLGFSGNAFKHETSFLHTETCWNNISGRDWQWQSTRQSQQTVTKTITGLSIQLVGHRLDNARIGVRFPVRIRNYSFLHSVQTCSLPNPASYPMDTGYLFREIKWPGRETYH